MTPTTLLLLLAASSAQPTNPLFEYKGCLMGSRDDPMPPGSPIESMAAAIARCSVERNEALTFLRRGDAPNDGEGENVANLRLLEEEMSLIWHNSRRRFEISVHRDAWGPGGVCLD